MLNKASAIHQGKLVRIDYIDSLRGLAICCVVLVHCGQMIYGLPKWLASLASYAGKGVELFFLLSALTLVTIYKDRRGTLAEFFIRRFFRIAPMFYVGVVFYLLLDGVGPQRPFSPEGVSLRSILLTFLFVHGWSPSAFNAVVPGGWSISDEAMFYILFPLLLTFVSNWKRSVIAMISAAVISRTSFVEVPYILVGHWYEAYPVKTYAAFLFTTQLFSFMCGFLAYFLCDLIGHRVTKTIASVATYLIFWLIIGTAVSGNKTLTNYLVADVLFVGFVVSVSVSQAKLLVNSMMQHIGLVSYSVYIVHFALVMTVQAWVLPALVNTPPVLQLTFVYGIVLAASIGLATITHRWIELPGVSAGKRLSRICSKS